MFCFEICTPEGRGGDKGGSANFKTKHTEPLTQEMPSALYMGARQLGRRGCKCGRLSEVREEEEEEGDIPFQHVSFIPLFLLSLFASFSGTEKRPLTLVRLKPPCFMLGDWILGK